MLSHEGLQGYARNRLSTYWTTFTSSVVTSHSVATTVSTPTGKKGQIINTLIIFKEIMICQRIFRLHVHANNYLSWLLRKGTLGSCSLHPPNEHVKPLKGVRNVALCLKLPLVPYTVCVTRPPEPSLVAYVIRTFFKLAGCFL